MSTDAVSTGGTTPASCGTTSLSAASSVFAGCTPASAPRIASATPTSARPPFGLPFPFRSPVSRIVSVIRAPVWKLK